MADQSFLDQRLDASTWPIAVGDIVALLAFLLVGTLQHTPLPRLQAEPIIYLYAAGPFILQSGPEDTDRETILAGETTPEEFAQLREEWRAMGRDVVAQMQDEEYRRREVVPFYVTVGHVDA